jgi:hypothetical protein
VRAVSRRSSARETRAEIAGPSVQQRDERAEHRGRRRQCEGEEGSTTLEPGRARGHEPAWFEPGETLLNENRYHETGKHPHSREKRTLSEKESNQP